MSYPTQSPCPCKSGLAYGRCCGPYHRGEPAPTPAALMRSRFCAYALRKPAYIMETTHPDGPQWRPNASVWRREIEQFARVTRFRDLAIEETSGNGSSDDIGDEGFVTFYATLEAGGRDVSFRERSLFRRHDGRWKYHSGEHYED